MDSPYHSTWLLMPQQKRPYKPKGTGKINVDSTPSWFKSRNCGAEIRAFEAARGGGPIRWLLHWITPAKNSVLRGEDSSVTRDMVMVESMYSNTGRHGIHGPVFQT